MGLGRYNGNDFYYERKHRFFGRKTAVFFLFLIVLGVIYMTTVYDDGITGNVVGSININNSFLVSAETEIPEVNLKGDYEGIIFEGLSNSDLNFGDSKISLTASQNKLEVYDFSGKISLNKGGINVFDGKTSRIVLNGIPISRESDKSLKVSLDSGAKGKSFAFTDDIYLEELDFVTSGNIVFNQDKITLSNDNLIIKGFFGKLKIENNKMFIEGLINELEIKGINKNILIKR